VSVNDPLQQENCFYISLIGSFVAHSVIVLAKYC